MIARCRTGAAIALLMLLGACQQIARPTVPASAPAAELPANKPVAAKQAPAVPEAKAPVPALSEPEIEPAPAASTGQEVFARLRQRLSAPACIAGANADRWRKHYAGKPELFARHLQAVLPMLDFVSLEAERAQLPAEFALIPLVESWYRPDAMGRGGPAGMWQMIASTARHHDIHIQDGYDGRLSPVESTRAALAYLGTLYSDFGDWQAAVLAYNIGSYRLHSAIKRAGTAGVSAEKRRPPGLPAPAYDYIGKLQALACLIAEPQQYRLQLPETAVFVPLTVVSLDARIGSLDQFAAETGRDADQLKRLNPDYRNGRIPADAPRLVLAPPASASALPTTAATTPIEPSATDDATAAAPTQVHRVIAGDTLWSIAKRYGIPVKQLQRINGLGGKSSLHIGQQLKLLP